VVAFLCMPETNPHIILQRRAKKMRKETGDERWHSKKAVKETPTQLLLLSLYRPMKVSQIVVSRSDHKLLIYSPIVLSLAMYPSPPWA